MTAKEKAKELFDKMYQVDDIMGNYPMCFDTSKKCALIAVDEIIKASPSLPILSDSGTYGNDIIENNIYWNEVKEEITKLNK